MKDDKKYTIAVLQDLIKTNKDEYLLFEVASRRSDDNELKSLLVDYTCEKEKYIVKLESEVLRLGGCSAASKNDSENSIEFYKASSFEENPNGLIEECLKKDDLALKRYFYAIRKNIMWEVIPIVAKQYFGSKSFYDQIKNICMERPGRLLYKMGIN
ncbi:MAG: PA2169 family four-helix-bundle protein [Ignavibacteriaceae bacterium]|nr:PA2169 family four-helix-bundle protein [Ignavibacteriaceae bacterium]